MILEILLALPINDKTFFYKEKLLKKNKPRIGEIVEVNSNLETDAAIINQDAENTGWIFKMKISNSTQYDDLMTEDEYKKFLEQ